MVVHWWRNATCLIAGLAGLAGGAPAWTYEPVALRWTAAEVERATAVNGTAIVQRAERAGRLGCRAHCERIERIHARLVAQARRDSERGRAIDWSLTVVRLPDVEALALPGGQIVVSEDFIDERASSDEALAFVLAHEMAHSILEHERQALSFAHMLLPRQVTRSVRDMYAELDFNFALLKAMEPVMQQGEFEADELGLLLAASAGYAPERQLEFLAREVAAAGDGAHAGDSLVRTHPPAAQRLAALRARLPLAQRLVAPAAE